jgi:Ca-activated chloride channel family protein
MGGTKGVPIPLKKGRSSAGYLKDNFGNTVITALNPEVLSDIAESGGGQYLSAKNTQSSLNALFQEIKRLDQQEFNTKVYVGFEDRFQFFLLPGILLIMLSISLWERKSKWI